MAGATGMMRAQRCLWAVAVLISSGACVAGTKIVTSPPGATLYVDGEDIGESPHVYAESVFPGRHRIEARLKGYRSKTVVVERTETDWVVVGTALAGTALCLGPACALGAVIPNIGLCGSLSLLFVAPSLWTIPAISVAAFLGSTPLALLALADRSPRLVRISLEQDGTAPVPAARRPKRG